MKIKLKAKIFFALAVLVSTNMSSYAQTPDSEKDVNIDAASKRAVIQTLNTTMQKKYIFPEVAKRVEVSINKHLKNGDYDKTSSSQAFAKLLTEHLQAETHDKHLHIRFEEEEIPVFDGQGEPSPEDLANADIEEMTFMKSINFGVERVERLPGNIGYLDFRGFGDTEKVGHAIAAAMTLLNASDALIIDLRKNGGGSPSTVALLASYFVPPKTHLNDIYNREENTTTQMWSTSYTAGPRYDKNKQVYVLTSNRTFSAAEDFTYTMQSLKRSVTVGEVTGGGAHPVSPSRLNAHLLGMIPFGRSINPITKSNWEGTGVQPELKTSANEALKLAHTKALEHLLTIETHPGKKHDLEIAMTDLKKADTAVSKTPASPATK